MCVWHYWILGTSTLPSETLWPPTYYTQPGYMVCFGFFTWFYWHICLTFLAIFDFSLECVTCLQEDDKLNKTHLLDWRVWFCFQASTWNGYHMPGRVVLLYFNFYCWDKPWPTAYLSYYCLMNHFVLWKSAHVLLKPVLCMHSMNCLLLEKPKSSFGFFMEIIFLCTN